MAHLVSLGFQTVQFDHITSISNIATVTVWDYIFLVQNEDSIDIWATTNKIRGANEIVRYYKLWNGRDINEQDMILVRKQKF